MNELTQRSGVTHHSCLLRSSHPPPPKPSVPRYYLPKARLASLCPCLDLSGHFPVPTKRPWLTFAVSLLLCPFLHPTPRSIRPPTVPSVCFPAPLTLYPLTDVLSPRSLNVEVEFIYRGSAQTPPPSSGPPSPFPS